MPLTWQSLRGDFLEASELEIEEAFGRTPPAGSHQGRVSRLSRTVLVKQAGLSEWQNLCFAWNAFNGTPLRVPEPIRYFKSVDPDRPGSEYVVMEHLDGLPLNECGSEANIEAVCDAILLLHTHAAPSTQPGPLTGGPALGYPWGLGEAEQSFTTFQDLEKCLNKRLTFYAKRKRAPRSEWALRFPEATLQLCHMDLVPRNILVCHDGSIAILDWETLALYPGVFELASLEWGKYCLPSEQHPVQDALISGMKQRLEGTDAEIMRIEVVHGLSISHGWHGPWAYDH